MSSTRVVVDPRPFIALSATQSAGLARGAKAYGRFLGVAGELATPR